MFPLSCLNNMNGTWPYIVETARMHSMYSKVCEMAECLSVCLSHHANHHADRRCRSAGAGAGPPAATAPLHSVLLQMRAVSYWQPKNDAEHRLLLAGNMDTMCGFVSLFDWTVIAFSALTLVIGWQEGHPSYKKTEWWGSGVVICLEWGADLHMAQRMSLPLTVPCFSKIQIGFTFLVPAHPGSPRQRAVKWLCVCVCVCVRLNSDILCVA